MFSGKTSELLRRLRRERVARRPLQVFKPEIDERYSVDEIVSHDSLRMRAEPVREWPQVLARLRPETEVVGIDEANLLGPSLTAVVQSLVARKLRIVVSGLDMDYLGHPFAPIPDLLAMADEVYKTAAVCMRCGCAAIHTQRLRHEPGLIVVGAADLYEARCRACFNPACEPRQARTGSTDSALATMGFCEASQS
jgi:thymidine kinase